MTDEKRIVKILVNEQFRNIPSCSFISTIHLSQPNMHTHVQVYSFMGSVDNCSLVFHFEDWGVGFYTISIKERRRLFGIELVKPGYELHEGKYLVVELKDANDKEIMTLHLDVSNIIPKDKLYKARDSEIGRKLIGSEFKIPREVVNED